MTRTRLALRLRAWDLPPRHVVVFPRNPALRRTAPRAWSELQAKTRIGVPTLIGGKPSHPFVKHPFTIVATIGVLLSVSCGERESAASPGVSDRPAEPTESQLLETKDQLESEVSEQRLRLHELHRDISQLNEILDEIRPQLQLLDAEKKLMLDDVMRLREQVEIETEGFIEAPNRPINEYFRETIQKMDQLLQENQELKRKLEAAAE